MASADLAEVAEALTELSQPALQHIFVKQVRCQQRAENVEHDVLTPVLSQTACWEIGAPLIMLALCTTSIIGALQPFKFYKSALSISSIRILRRSCTKLTVRS